jgi:hypothetical protein
VLRQVDTCIYLDDGSEGILLPKRFVPEGVQEGDKLKVFYTIILNSMTMGENDREK